MKMLDYRASHEGLDLTTEEDRARYRTRVRAEYDTMHAAAVIAEARKDTGKKVRTKRDAVRAIADARIVTLLYVSGCRQDENGTWVKPRATACQE